MNKSFIVKSISLLLILLAASCSSCQKYEKPENDEIFNIYKESFKKEAEIRGIYIPEYRMSSIVFRENESCGENIGINVAGCCHYAENLIIINSFHWKRYQEHEKEQLVFHELGHCVLQKGHSNNPDDIMYAYMGMFQNGNYYKHVRSYLLDELFKR